MLTDNPNAPLLLVVEDDSLHVNIIQRSFNKTKEEYRLEIAGSLLDAWKVIERRPPDLVLTDYLLPDGDGNELIVMVNNTCPVIMMTSQGNEQAAVRAMKIGAQDYIVKSAETFEELPRTIKYAFMTWGMTVAQRVADEAVSRAKHDWERTFDAIPDLISIIDTSQTIIRANKAMAHACGLTPEQIIGRKCYEVVHGLKCSPANCPLVNGEESNLTVEESGLDCIFDVTISPLRNEEGDIATFVHVMRDITERKQAEEERLTLEKQFLQAQKLESLGVLAGGIAHDFNNILTIILGHCYIVDEDIDPKIDQKDHVKQIEKAANRAADLCRQMLTYAGSNSLVHSRMNLWLLVDENVKMLRSALKKNVGIESDLRYAVPEISGYSAQMQQVVMNLIINAAEAIGDKNGTIKITLAKMIVDTDQEELDFLHHAIPPGNYACLTVSDNGCGMDVETQKRVFEPFYTTKVSGRGLGMSAVLGIINSHGGSLQLSSTQGVGTTFKLYLPSFDRIAFIETMPTAWSVPSGNATGAILLVDDEESIRIIGSALLKAMGFSVMTAINGREALEIYREHIGAIDLILLDLLMPEMGGIDTYRKLREISPAIPVVICSGNNVNEIQESIELDEHAASIQKPYKLDQLRDTLMELIDKTEQHLQ